MHDLFISYANSDQQRVRPLIEALREEHFDVWWDERLVASDQYTEVIEKALNESRCVVVCWTRSALHRDWVRAEAEKARGSKRAVIPVLFDDIELPLPFNVSQSVRLTQWSGDRSDALFVDLVAGIREKLTCSRPLPSVLSSRPRKVALVVGVGAIDSDTGALPAAESNARAVAELLRQAGGFEVTEVLSPDRQELECAVQAAFRSADATGFVLFYYSGHVLVGEDNDLLLTAKNTRLDGCTALALDFRDVEKKYLARAKCERKLIIADVCYLNLAGADVEPLPARELLTRVWRANLDASNAKMVIASGGGAANHLARWREPHTALTHRLLRGLGPDARSVDANGDKSITVGELANYLDSGVSDEAAKPFHWDFVVSSDTVHIIGTDPPPPPAGALNQAQKDFVAKLAPELKDGRIIPFFGGGVYGNGPLSFSAITRALVRRLVEIDNFNPSVGIATAAESLRLHLESRDYFLEAFRDILAEQANECETPLAYDLVLDLKRPWFIVTVNYDDLLQRRLKEDGRPYVLVTHILRTGTDDYDETHAVNVDQSGKILVIRAEGHPAVKSGRHAPIEISLSSDIALDDDDCVVYQLLGAPFINDMPAVRDLRLDTAVITETDHIDFLIKLRNPETSVPKRLTSRLFRNKKVLFLEYNLDVWHYRLVGHLFRHQKDCLHADGAVTLGHRPYVVRTTDSTVEQGFWQRFSPEMVSIAAPALLQALRARRTP